MHAWMLAGVIGFASPPPPPPPPAPDPGPGTNVDTPATAAAEPVATAPLDDRAARNLRLARDAAKLRRRERGYFIAAGVVGGLGTIGHIVSSVFVGRAFTESCEEDCYPEISLLYDLGATVPMATGAALMGAGFGLRGRRHAFENATGGPRVGRRMKNRGVFGWALFGVGLATYALTRGVAWACSDACFVGVWEGGFWASASLMAAGLVLGPYASGYNLAHRKLAVQGIAVAPFSDGRGVRGFAVSGRF